MGTFSKEEEGEEPLEGEELTKSDESFSLSSSFLDGDSKGRYISESLGTPSVASPGSLDEPISGGEEEEEEFGRIGENTCKAHQDFSLSYQSLDQSKEISLHSLSLWAH